MNKATIGKVEWEWALGAQDRLIWCSKGGVTEGSLEEVTLKLIPKNEQGLAKRARAAGQTGLCEAKRNELSLGGECSFIQSTNIYWASMCARNSSMAQEFAMSQCFVTRWAKLHCKAFILVGRLVMRPPEVGRRQEVRAGRTFTALLRARFYHGTKGRHRRVLSREWHDHSSVHLYRWHQITLSKHCSTCAQQKAKSAQIRAVGLLLMTQLIKLLTTTSDACYLLKGPGTASPPGLSLDWNPFFLLSTFQLSW